MLSQADLWSMLHYCPGTGDLRWIATRGRHLEIPAGSLVGCNRSFSIGRKTYLKHRVIWCMMTGEWPEFEIDHKDRIGANNRWHNLRPCTHEQNSFNRGIYSTNKSGHTGVSWSKNKTCWRVTIQCQHIGYFVSKEIAIATYEQEAAKRYGKFKRDAS